MTLDSLSRGEQYLILRNRDFEILVTNARNEITYTYYLLEKYPNAYSPIDKETMLRDVEMWKKDIKHFSKYLQNGGVENDEPVTESKDSESPPNRYTGPTCTTV